MELQISLAGNSKDTAKFKSELVAKGYVIRIATETSMENGELVERPGALDSKDESAYKTFKDAEGKIRAELQVSLDAGENVEYTVRAKVNIGTADETTSYCFSVHQHNVDDKLEVFDKLMTQLYGQPNQ